MLIFENKNQEIEQDPKTETINTIKANYFKLAINYSNHYSIGYIKEKKFEEIMEIIYYIIEDICNNENADIKDIKNIGDGSYSSVLLIGNKVIKIGLNRVTPRFPNNPYINAILLRKEFPITSHDSIFVEVNEFVDTKTKITNEEIYNLYKKLRDLQLIWLDVSKRNVGRLLKDNKVYWKEDLFITDRSLGLETYRGNEMLKKGEIVIIDNDMIYDENSPFLSYCTPTNKQKEFEEKYQKERKLHR